MIESLIYRKPYMKKTYSKNDYYFIFDLDGTLTDTLQDIACAVNYMLKKNGFLSKSLEEIKNSIGAGITEVVKHLTQSHDEAYIETCVDSFREYYHEHILDKTILYKGVDAFLQTKSFSGSVVTNKPEIFARKILEGLGILDRFDACIGGLEGFPHKPDPSSTRYIIETFAKNRRPVFIGDSIIDLKTARNTRIPFYFAEYGYGDDIEAIISQADGTLKQFSDFSRIFS